jgi:hypothetical protein
MEKSEQRFIIKFLNLKSLDSETIHAELTAIFGATTYLLRQIKSSQEMICLLQSRRNVLQRSIDARASSSRLGGGSQQFPE